MTTTPAIGGGHMARGGPRLRSPRTSAGRPQAFAAARQPLVAMLPPVAAAVIGTVAVACGVVLAVRRLSGGFEVTDSAAAWLVAAAGITLVAIADQSCRHVGGVLGSVAARCGLVLGVVAVALPPSRGDWASMLAVLAAIAVAVVRMPIAAPPRASKTAPARRIPPTHRSRPLRRRDGHVRREEEEPGRLLQRLERFESPTGADCLRGRLNLALPAGSRAAHAHVGFCPSFAETPSVRVTTEYDGVEAVVTAAEVLPWGVRVECRLTEPAEEPLEIPIDVFVQAPG